METPSVAQPLCGLYYSLDRQPSRAAQLLAAPPQTKGINSTTWTIEGTRGMDNPMYNVDYYENSVFKF